MDDEKALGKTMSGDSLGKRPGRYDELRNDPEMEGLTLYEKKALLVNRELNSHGMGKPIWFRFAVLLLLLHNFHQRRRKKPCCHPLLYFRFQYDSLTARLP